MRLSFDVEMWRREISEPVPAELRAEIETACKRGC